MADFSALKTSIQNYIKQNGNEEITGNLLQQILLSMVTTLGDSAINNLVTALNAEIANRVNADTELGGNITTLQGNINSEATTRANADTELGNRITSEAEARAGADNILRGLIDGITDNIENGYVYAGIATPSTTPASGKVFYLALTAGTYTNFGAIVVPQGINILKYNESAWSLNTFIGLDDAPTQGSGNLVKSGGTFNSIEEHYDNVMGKPINLLDDTTVIPNTRLVNGKASPLTGYFLTQYIQVDSSVPIFTDAAQGYAIEVWGYSEPNEDNIVGQATNTEVYSVTNIRDKNGNILGNKTYNKFDLPQGTKFIRMYYKPNNGDLFIYNYDFDFEINKVVYYPFGDRFPNIAQKEVEENVIPELNRQLGLINTNTSEINNTKTVVAKNSRVIDSENFSFTAGENLINRFESKNYYISDSLLKTNSGSIKTWEYIPVDLIKTDYTVTAYYLYYVQTVLCYSENKDLVYGVLTTDAPNGFSLKSKVPEELYGIIKYVSVTTYPNLLAASLVPSNSGYVSLRIDKDIFYGEKAGYNIISDLTVEGNMQTYSANVYQLVSAPNLHLCLTGTLLYYIRFIDSNLNVLLEIDKNDINDVYGKEFVSFVNLGDFEIQDSVLENTATISVKTYTDPAAEPYIYFERDLVRAYPQVDDYAGHILKGKNVFVIGDSYRWFANYLRSLTGANIYYCPEESGMISMYANQAKHVVERYQNGEQVDYVIYEDVHGCDVVDSAIPYYCKQMYSGRQYASKALADEDWSNNFATKVGAFTPVSMAAVEDTIQAITQTIQFTLSSGNTVCHAGVFKIQFGNYVATTTITEGMTLLEAINWINEIQYSETCPYWSNLNHHEELSEPKLVFTYIGQNPTDPEASQAITFDTGTTGIVAGTPVFNTSASTPYWHCFGSRNVSDWNNPSMWFTQASKDEITYRVKCGVIEYLQTMLPETRVVIIGDMTLGFEYGVGSFYYPDGTLNISQVLDSYYPTEGRRNMQSYKYIADRYNCQYIDVWHNIGISPLQWEEYFTDGDVHGDERWKKRFAEVVAGMIV